MSSINGTQANYNQHSVAVTKPKAEKRNPEQLRPVGTPSVSSADVPNTVTSGGLKR
jgi:hypothetical protein